MFLLRVLLENIQKQQIQPECCNNRSSHTANFFFVLPQWLLTKTTQDFCSRLFWTALPFCCPANIFAFKHRCSCGLRITGAFPFFFFLRHLCSAVSVYAAGEGDQSWRAFELAGHNSASFPACELSKSQRRPSVHQASAVCISELKLLRAHCVSFGACSLQTYSLIFFLSVLLVICGQCGPPYKPTIVFSAVLQCQPACVMLIWFLTFPYKGHKSWKCLC